jgi:quinoprotein glucose dehydrogenase
VDLSHGRTGTAALREGSQLIAAFECTPLVVDGVLYLSTPSSRVIALDAETGQEIWKFDPQENAGEKRGYLQHRGVAYWKVTPVHPGRLKNVSSMQLGMASNRLDARTGKPVAISARRHRRFTPGSR